MIDRHDGKLKYFRGATIKDMESDIKATLKREPDFIIIYVRTM